MQKDYIILSEKRYRVEVNWNAMLDFAEQRGLKNIGELMDVNEIDKDNVADLCAAGIREGERLEGRECRITGREVAEQIVPREMMRFVGIYVSHISPKLPEEGGDGEEKERP